jgi:hypothetical protein
MEHWASLVPKGGPQCPLLPPGTAASVLLTKPTSTVGRSARNCDCPLSFAAACSEGALRHCDSLPPRAPAPTMSRAPYRAPLHPHARRLPLPKVEPG